MWIHTPGVLYASNAWHVHASFLQMGMLTLRTTWTLYKVVLG